MSDDPLHSELEPLPATTDSANGVGPHDEDAATDSGADAEASVAALVEAPSEAEAESPDFLTRLADAMRQTVDAERSRSGDDIDRRRTELLAAIQTRRETEVNRMRELAADDRKSIERWADEERKRIQKERDERLAGVEADLATSLDEHGTTVDAEVERVEAAVAAHRAEVDAFFTSLGSETDPVRIAQSAGRRPTFPNLETEASAAAASGSPESDAEPVTATDQASTEGSAGEDEGSPSAEDEGAELVTASADGSGASAATAGVAVMDPIARLGLLRAGDQAVETPSPPAVPAGAWRPSEDAARDRPATPVGSSSGGLNPIGWIRRKDDSSDR
jgi:hypothetical protein